MTKKTGIYLVTLVICIVAFLCASVPLAHRFWLTSWAATARPIDMKVVSKRWLRVIDKYKYTIEYTFDVDGEVYSGIDDVEDDSLIIFYEPGNPENNWLEPNRWVTLLLIIVAGFTLFIGICSAFELEVRRRKAIW